MLKIIASFLRGHVLQELSVEVSEFKLRASSSQQGFLTYNPLVRKEVLLWILLSQSASFMESIILKRISFLESLFFEKKSFLEYSTYKESIPT